MKLGLSASAVALIGVAVGCDDDRSVQSYQTPKEDVRPALSFGPHGGGAGGATAPPMTAAPASSGPALQWTVPAGGPPPQRILAAVLPRDDRTWFFKLMGPADVVAAQKPAFDAFVHSLHFEAADAPSAPPPMPAPAPAASAQAAAPSSSTTT